ncbi:MAG: hypothetical protein AAGF11_27190, partial [Myxococcota bacterium]
LASDGNEVWDNEIRGNDSGGVMVIAYVDDLFSPPEDPRFDIYAEGNWIHDNMLEDNGQDPDELVLLLGGLTMGPTPDLIFDGCFDEAKDNADGSLSNCVSGLGDATFMAIDMCGQSMPESDPANYTCEHDPLPTEI